MQDLAALLVLLALCAGCAASHGVPDGGGAGEGGGLDAAAFRDAASMDAPRRDSGYHPPDAGIPEPDGALPDGTDCSEVDGFRRCGVDQCPYLCPGSPPVECVSQVPLCLPRDRSYCDYGVGRSVPLDVCKKGGPCLLPGDSPSANGAAGICAPVDLCMVDYRDAGLPPFHCAWTDMTPVTRAPPEAGCPLPPDPRTPFCAGACGDVTCPDPGTHLCVGLSDTRAFGVCEYEGLPCWQDPPGIITNDMMRCATAYGAPCACMVLHPQPADAPFPRGNIVLATTCLTYQTVYPDGVECRDVGWNVLH